MKKIVWSSALILVILTASLVFYFTGQGNDFKVDIQNTRTQYYVNESGWVLAATEYVNLYDGTTKMRALSRNLTWFSDTDYIYAIRKSTWKDNITTIQTYTFSIYEDKIDNVPIKNELNCINCKGKIVHYEIRDILYEGETEIISSPFSFGHNMNIEWESGSYYSKVFQQISSDKIIIKYKPKTNNESYSVRLFDPWASDSGIINGLPDIGSNSAPAVFYKDSSWYLISGMGAGKFSGFAWNGTSWNPNSTINASLPDIGDASTPAVFYKDSSWYLITGEINGKSYGFVWSGTQWVTNFTVNASLPSVGYRSTPAVFYKDSSWYMIIGEQEAFTQHFNGFVWSGTQWTANLTVNNSLPNTGDNSAPTVFQKDGTWYLISGHGNGWFPSFNWSGTAWQKDFAINETLGNIGDYYSIPNVFQKDGTWYLISGSYVGTFYGFEWEGFPVPSVILNVPINYYNTSNPTITFNITATDKQQITNVTFSIDGIVNETDTSKVNGSYQWIKTLSEGNHNWSVLAYNNNSQSNQSETRNLTVDYTLPRIKIVYPESINYSVNVTSINYTIIETNPNKCWYSNNSGTTNSSLVNAGNNFTNVISIEGSNTWTVFCNDTVNNQNQSSVTFLKDTINPLISFGTNTEINASLFSNRSWIYANVSVTEANEKNITFLLSYVNGTVVNLSTYTDSRRTINWTAGYGTYLYNVTIFDTANNYNSTETRTIYLSNIYLFFNEFQENVSIELNTTINLTGNTSVDFGLICIDINHPDYGYNYTCSNQQITLNLTFDYFRKKFLWDLLTTKLFNFSGALQLDNKNLTFTSHQFAEIDGLAFNISSSDNAENVLFYGANTTIFDRAYTGYLMGNNVYQNKSVNPTNGSLFNNYENLSFNNPGNQTVYFYLDNNAKIKNISMYVTGALYGFTFIDLFNNYNYIDKTKTTAQLFMGGSGIIQLANSSLALRVFDNFNDGKLNQLLWINSSTFVAAGYSAGVKEEGGYVEAYINVDNGYCADAAKSFLPNSSFLNYYTSDYLSFSVTSYSYGNEDSIEKNDCHMQNDIMVNGVVIWKEAGDRAVNGEEIDNANLDFELTKINSTHWRANISGLETKTFSSVEDCDGTGGLTMIYNYTNGSVKTDWADGDCTDTWASLSNSSLISMGSTYTMFVMHAVFQVDCTTDCYGNSYIRIDNVKNKMWYRNNGSVVSDIVFTSSSNIASSMLNVSNTSFVYYGAVYQAPNETIAYFLSADNGLHWESTNNSVVHNFVYPGKYIRWKVDLNTTDPGYRNITNVIHNVSINTPESYPSNVTFDFGNDGIWEVKLNGTFNPANGTILVDLTNASIVNAFNTRRTLYSHLYRIPLRISSTSPGLVNLFNFNITYDPNPVSLNITYIQDYLDDYGSNYTNFTIPIGAVNGSVNVSDIKFDYRGGNSTIEITIRNFLNTLNLTRYITAYHSDFYKILPYSWTEDIFFLPKTNNSKNISAYGQTLIKPLFNITTTNYGGRNENLSIRVDQTYSCLNLTWSNSSTKPAGNKINTTWQEIANNLGYLGKKNIWIWADLENCNASDQSMLTPRLDIISYCKDCVWEGQ